MVSYSSEKKFKLNIKRRNSWKIFIICFIIIYIIIYRKRERLKIRNLVNSYWIFISLNISDRSVKTLERIMAKAFSEQIHQNFYQKNLFFVFNRLNWWIKLISILKVLVLFAISQFNQSTKFERFYHYSLDFPRHWKQKF